MALFLSWSTNRRESQIIQESKAFYFLLLIKVLLMLSYFLYNSIIVTWCIQKSVNLVYMVGQTNKFELMFQLPCSISILINKVNRFSKHSRSYNFLNFFVDWSITDAKLFFEAPTQMGMIIDDTVRLVCLRTCYCWEKFLGNEFDQIQSWYGQVMSLKLD